MTSNFHKITVAALLLVVAGLAYWFWAEQQKRVQHQAIALLVADATAQLRAPAGGAGAARMDSAIQALHAIGASRHRDFADAAEHYMIATRAIVQRRADAQRLAQEAAASRQKLRTHMSAAAHRDGGWIRDAAALKKSVEKDYFDLDLTLKALDDLLGSLPETQKRLAAYVEPSLLMDEKLREGARQRVQADLKRLAEDLQAMRSLQPGVAAPN